MLCYFYLYMYIFDKTNLTYFEQSDCRLADYTVRGSCKSAVVRRNTSLPPTAAGVTPVPGIQTCDRVPHSPGNISFSYCLFCFILNRCYKIKCCIHNYCFAYLATTLIFLDASICYVFKHKLSVQKSPCNIFVKILDLARRYVK